MIKIKFAIDDALDYEYLHYEYLDPELQKYCSVYIDDEMYIDNWWDRLILMKTFFHDTTQPDLGLDRFGVTRIPPESLPAFQNIVISDSRINVDNNLVDLANLIQRAIVENQYMIHYGM